jgi:hypothetical protein
LRFLRHHHRGRERGNEEHGTGNPEPHSAASLNWLGWM